MTSVSGGTNFLQINDGYINSNKITVSKWLMDQITVNRAASSDVVMTTGITGTVGVMMNGAYYFPGYDTAGHQKLFRINSTGVYAQISNLVTGGSDNVQNLAAFNNQLYFMSNANAITGLRLFRYNGTTITQLTQTAAMGMIAGNTTARPIAVNSVGTKIYFAQANAGGFTKLHSIDTSDNVVQVADLNGSTVSDTFGSTNGQFDWIGFNGYVYFEANCTNPYCPTSSGLTSMRIDNSNNVQVIGIGRTISVIFNNKLYYTSFTADITDLSLSTLQII